MSNTAPDRGRVGIFGAARRALRASTNASKASLRPIAENHPFTSSGQNEKSTDPEKEGYTPSGTTGTPPKEAMKDDEADDRDRRRELRTIPPWIQSFEEGDDDTEQDQRSYLLPNVPATSRAPHHQYMPEPKNNAPKGRKYDYARERDPVTARRPLELIAPHWQSFTAAATPPRLPDEPGMRVDEEWERENLKDLEGPWNPMGMGEDDQADKGFWLFSPERRSATVNRSHRILMNNSFVPLILRFLIMVFVLTSLGVAVTIFRRTRDLNDSPLEQAGTVMGPGSNSQAICQNQPSTYLAVIVGSIAVVYLLYITWDEFSSKPLGLRRSGDKIRLLFLDPVLFVFSAANLSIAFNTYLDRQWACFENAPSNQNNQQAAQSVCIFNQDLCDRQKTLAGLLLIVLVFWMLTFAISVLRVVERTAR